MDAPSLTSILNNKLIPIPSPAIFNILKATPPSSISTDVNGRDFGIIFSMTIFAG